MTRGYCLRSLDVGVACGLLYTLSVGCAVPIRDHEFCSDGGKLGAFCVWEYSGQSRRLTKEEWDLFRVGQFCTADGPGKHGDTVADLKATIEKLCSVTSCDLPKP